MTHGAKQFSAIFCKAHGAPDDAQLALINNYTLAPHTAEQVYVRTAYIAHNGIDRDDEVFDDALLSDFARTLPGKGLFIKHPRGYDGDSGPGPGRWFSARVVEMSLDEARAALRTPGLQFPPSAQTAKLVEASFFIPRTEGRAELIADIDAGAAADISIGFDASSREPIADGSDKVIAMRWKAPGEALEASLVWLGAQPGARVHKHATTDNPDDGDTTMSDKQAAEQLKALQTKHEQLTKDLEAATTKAAAYDELAKAVGEDLAKDHARLARIVNDGRAYHKSLVDDIVRMERLSGIVKGDDEAAIEQAKAAYKDRDIDFLQAWQQRLARQVKGADEGAGIEGGDPNANRGSGEGAKGLRDASVTQKALGVHAA